MSLPAGSEVGARLAALRKAMAERGLDVYLVPSTDEHQSEFVPATAERRQAISGFNGSAGDVAVLADSAHLFVDSRYHLQAEQQTDPALYTVHKLGLDGERDLPAFLADLVSQGKPLRVGFDPFLHNLLAMDQLASVLQGETVSLTPVTGNLVDEVWTDKPAPAQSTVYALPADLTGESAVQKLGRVRAAMQAQGADVLVLSKLDDVAWLTNLRGRDIPHNPVFDAYLVVTDDAAVCFTDNPVPDDVQQALAPAVTFAPGEAFRDRLSALAQAAGDVERRVWLDRQGTSHGVRLLTQGAKPLYQSPNPVGRMKACKNEAEIAASLEGHVRAGCAKVRAFHELAQRLDAGQRLSEADFADLLYGHYAREADFFDLSFPTIAGYGANSAIVHYSYPSAEVLLAPGGLLLVDSGIQIAGATTDDTRTVAIGDATDEQRRLFTHVLRGHIRLAMQRFPKGTSGQTLDVLARSDLWNQGLDYGHGTGHGVGAFLNVHEGPQNISSRGAVPLEVGMIVSDEPGYYKGGWGGIRLENLYVVEQLDALPPHPSGSPWLGFSSLTVLPFEPRMIDAQALAAEERAWLNAYHDRVRETLSPRLDGAARDWLQAACRPV
jgi:Xaa-Pro aminopeptidase